VNILLIEDNPVDAQAIMLALERAQLLNAKVTHVESLTEAADVKPSTFDVILLDLSLGDSHGLTSVRGARSCLPMVPIVVLTADRSEELAFAALREGAQDYLFKGAYSVDTLTRSIRYAIERHTLKTRLMRADRLAAVGQLAAGVAHEVSNPASFVLGNTLELEKRFAELSTLIRQLPASFDATTRAMVAEVLAQITDAGRLVSENLSGMDRIATVTRELQNYARIGDGHIGLLSMNDIVKEACRLVHSSLRHRAQLVLELEPLPPLPGDRGRLEQLLTNLLVNATQSIAPGQAAANRVSIVSRSFREAGGDVIELVVEDTGCGIEPDRVERIFEPFYTTKPKGQGTGLGLSLAAEIARAHGGRLDCESTVGEGTRFVVQLPCSNGLIVSASAPTPPPVTGTAARSRILLVDDEPLILEVFRAYLGEQHDVVASGDGAEALKLLVEGGDFDIVVCDFTMPGMDGADLQAAVARRMPHLANRFLFCTGGAITSSARQALERLGNRVLFKPIRPAVLLEVINTRLVELNAGSGEPRPVPANDTHSSGREMF